MLGSSHSTLAQLAKYYWEWHLSALSTAWEPPNTLNTGREERHPRKKMKRDLDRDIRGEGRPRLSNRRAAGGRGRRTDAQL